MMDRRTTSTTAANPNHHFVELPSLEEIEAMDEQRSKAIESLEISEQHQHIKCQGCGSLQPIMPGLTTPHSGRIYELQTRIRLAEKYNVGSAKKEKEELKDLLKEERKRDILRRLPLYSSRMTGYKWLCSVCYDKAYLSSRKKEKE